MNMTPDEKLQSVLIPLAVKLDMATLSYVCSVLLDDDFDKSKFSIHDVLESVDVSGIEY